MSVKLKNKAGFTVAELIIVSAIFMLMATVMIANFRRGEHVSQLLLATEEVTGQIRKMQTESLTGQTEGEIIASGGIGLYFNLAQPQSYLLFRDDGTNIYEPANDTLLETATIPQNVSLTDLSTNPLTIVFNPPKPTVFINGNPGGAAVEIYLLSVKISDREGRVTLNPLSGRITAELINQ